MSQTPGGVNISLREIYDTMQEVKNDVKSLAPKMTQMEKDIAEALASQDQAKEAFRIATKHEDSLKWFTRAILAAFITGFVGLLIAFMALAIQLSVQSQLEKIQGPTQVNVETNKPKE